MADKCPGQDGRNLKVELVTCPACGYQLEMFSDEMKVSCPECNAQVCRVRLPTCINWCKHARECVGEEKWRQYNQKTG